MSRCTFTTKMKAASGNFAAIKTFCMILVIMQFRSRFNNYASIEGFYNEPYKASKLELGYPSYLPGVRIIEMPMHYFPAGVLGFTNTVDTIWIPYGLEQKKMVLAHEEEHVKDPHATEDIVQHRARARVGYDDAMAYIETYGCASNQNDSEIIAGLLSRQGFHVIGNIEIADIVIVNTCSVKEATSNKIHYRIAELMKRYSTKKFIITGCMPEAEYDALKNIAPRASLVGTRRIMEIAEAVRKALEGRQVEWLGTKGKNKLGLPKIPKNPVIHIVEICSGCELACSYCATKLAKGPLFSYPEDRIIAEIAEAKDAGCKEFWITGQDVAAYGRDCGSSLPKLIRRILDSVKGKYFLRLGMMNPENVRTMKDELAAVYQDSHVFRFLHMPVQSGSNSVLKKMNRPYSVEDFAELVLWFRKAVPGITIWTDVIAGFPSETNEDFQQTIALMERTEPDFVNVSRYSVRSGTKAAEMEQLPTEIKKERSRLMSALADKLAKENNQKWIGWQGELIVDEYNNEKGNWIGRNIAYKPIVLKAGRLGEIQQVKITGAEKTHLVAG